MEGKPSVSTFGLLSLVILLGAVFSLSFSTQEAYAGISDTEAPTGTVTIIDTDGFTATTSVSLTLTCSDNVDCTEMNIDGGGWETFSTSGATILSGGDGLKTVSVIFRDAALNESTPASEDTTTLDETGPTGTLVIVDSSGFTASFTPTLTLTCDDGSGSGCDLMDIDLQGDEAFSTSGNASLTAPDGPKTSSVVFTDALGNISTVTIDDTTFLDQTGPTGTLVITETIPGFVGTTTPAVTLTCDDGSGSGCDLMDIDLQGDEAFSTSGNASFSAGTGPKTSSVVFTDALGNPSNTTIDDTTVLDQTAPTGTIVISELIFIGFVNTTTPPVTLTCVDDDSGCALMDIDSVGNVAFSTSGFASLSSGDGLKTSSVVLTDGVGNTSTITIDDITTLDQTGPTGTLVITEPIPGFVSMTTPPVTLTCDDGTGSGCALMDIDSAGDVAFSTSGFASLSSGDGLKTSSVVLTDNLGNPSTGTIDDTTTLDQTGPTGSITITDDFPGYVNSLAEDAVLTCDDGSGSGCALMDIDSAGDVTFAAASAISLTAGADGLRTSTVVYTDELGNISTGTIDDDTTLDTTGPTGTILITEDFTGFVNSLAEAAVLTCGDGTGSGCALMNIDSQGDETVDTAGTTALAAGADGPRTSSVVFTDNVGNPSATITSPSTTLDTTGPTGTILITEDFTGFVNSLAEAAVLTCGDGTGSGCALMNIDSQGDETVDTAGTTALAAGADGPRTSSVVFTDNVGNPSATITSPSTTLDTTGPTGSITITDDFPGFVDSVTEDAVLTCDDGTGSGCALMDIDSAGDVAFATASSISLSAGDGPKTSSVVLTDNVGNASTGTIDDDTTLDTTAPETTPGQATDTNTDDVDNSATFFTASDGITLPFTTDDDVVPDGGGFFTGSGVADTECDIDGDGFLTCTSAVQYGSALDCEGSPCPGLDDGTHVVTFESTDNLDYRESSPTYTWNSDTTSPTGSVTIDATEGVDAAFTLDDNVTLSGTCDDDLVPDGGGGFITGSGCAELDYSFDAFATAGTTVVIDNSGTWSTGVTLPATGWGTHTVTIQFRDAVGNDIGTQATDDIFQNARITIDNIDDTTPRWDLDDVTVSFTVENGRVDDQVEVFYSFDSILTLPNSPIVKVDFDDVLETGSTISPYPFGSPAENNHTVLARILEFDDTIVVDSLGISTTDSNLSAVEVLKHRMEIRNLEVNPNPVAITSPLAPNMLVIGGDLVDLELTDLGFNTITGGVPNLEILLTGDGVTLLNEGTGIPANPFTGRVFVSDSTGVSIDPGISLSVHEGAEFSFGILPSCINMRVENEVEADYIITDGQGHSKNKKLKQAGNGLDAILQACDNQGVASIAIGQLTGDTTIDFSTLTGEVMGEKINPVNLGNAEIGDDNTSVNILGGEFKLDAGSPTGLTLGTPRDVFANVNESTNYLAPNQESTSYETNPNSESMGGLGLSSIVSDSGVTHTAIVCEPDDDTDEDGLCDSHEDTGTGIPFSAGGSPFFYPIPNTTVGTQDAGIEIDYMTGLQLESEVTTEIASLFATNGKFIEFDEQDMGFSNLNTDVWINELTGFSNRDTSFDCIKADNYGAPNEQVDITQGSLITLSNQNPPKFWRTGDVFGVRITTPTDPITGGITEGDIRIKFLLDTQATPSFSSGPSADTPSPAPGLTLDSVIGDIEQVDTDLYDITIVVHYTALTPQTNVAIGTISYDLVFDIKKSANIELVHCDTTIFSSLLEARAQYWRNAIIVHSIGGSTGHSELNGNDMTLAFDEHPTDESTADEQELKWKSQAGTFLHELGHIFNLKHGAPAFEVANPLNTFPDADINCQVTDSGVMPYSRQVPAPLGFLPVDLWTLDYSHGWLGSIDETSVAEVGGRPFSTGPMPNPIITWGMPEGVWADFGLAGIGNAAGLNLNWNGNGVIVDTASPGTPVDTNDFGISGCGATPGDVYQDEDQWANLRFVFTDTANGLDGFGPDNPHNDGQQEAPTGTTGAEGAAAGGTIKAWGSPISFDGTSHIKKGNPGSTLPIKLTIKDTMGGNIEDVVVTALVSDKNAQPGDEVDNQVFCAVSGGTITEFIPPSSPGGDYSCSWPMPNQVGQYYMRVSLSHPNNESETLLVLEDIPHCLGLIEQQGQCPDITDININEIGEETIENLDNVVSLSLKLSKKGPGDPPATPTVSIGDSTELEGDSGTTSLVFAIDRSGDLSNPSTIEYTTLDGTATTADSDYVPVITPIVVNFVANDFQEIITIDVNGDTDMEPDEDFTIVLSAPVNAIIGDGSGLGTILNDDTPNISISDFTANEGDSGTTSFDFIVTRTGGLNLSITVDFTTVDGSATTADSDYVAQTDMITFGVGVTQQTITILVNGDTTNEPDENFTVVLSSPTPPAVLTDDTGLGTISNDDDTPMISIGDFSTTEGDSGTKSFDFIVTRTGSTLGSTTVDFTTVDGSATTADSDYIAQTDMITFGPGSSQETITILVNGDTTNEGDENFTVVLSSPTPPAILTDETGLGTILEDDIAGITVTSVTPSSGSIGETVSVTITGTGFDPGAIITFEEGTGKKPKIINPIVVNPTEITADFEISAKGTKVSPWKVVITNPDLGSDFGVFNVIP